MIKKGEDCNSVCSDEKLLLSITKSMKLQGKNTVCLVGTIAHRQEMTTLTPGEAAGRPWLRSHPEYSGNGLPRQITEAATVGNKNKLCEQHGWSPSILGRQVQQSHNES
jgi:hypothetical protein